MQFQKRAKTTKEKITKSITALFLLITLIMSGCAAPGAFKTSVTGVEARFEKLEKVAEELSVWKSSVQAETINYGGAGTVAIGLIVITVVFLGAFALMIRMLLQKTNMLKLVTGAVQKTDANTRKAIKDKITEEVSNGGPFKRHHKHQLRNFVEKAGTFAEKD